MLFRSGSDVKFFREKKPSTVIFGATPKGRDLAPRIAADLVCGVTADVTELDIDQDTGLVICSRPAMSGNILADIISPDYRPQVCTVRPGIFRSPAPDASRKGEAVHVKVELDKNLLVSLSVIMCKERIIHHVHMISA